MKKILIGLSWPYANGELHIGHVGSSVPADVLARFHRQCGDDVCFVSGSDCYGTPISIQAQSMHVSPVEISNMYHEKFVDIFKKLDFSFENFFKTTDERHINFSQNFHKELSKTNYIYNKKTMQLHCNNCHRFLPDRYVEGLCPFCKKPAKGDSCEYCGKILEAENLLNPKCKICNSEPVLKATEQIYLDLPQLQLQLENFYDKRKDTWSQNAQGMTNRYLTEGLRERPITRNLDWGVPLFGENENSEKRIYNWAENVLGYLSGCKVYCDNNGKNWLDFWKNKNAKHYYVHAKDNIPFHTIIFPGLLLANPNEYHLPDTVLSYEYVTMEGEKISKSKGTALTARELLEEFNADFVRYYFAKNINDKKDTNFSFTDFVTSINGELINNFANFVNRTLSFVKNKFNGEVKVYENNVETMELIRSAYEKVATNIQQGKTSTALKNIFELVSYANKKFDANAPWQTIKTDPELCEKQCFEFVTIILNLANMLLPFIPNGACKILEWMGDIKNEWGVKTFKNNVKLGDFCPLYQRLDMENVKLKFKNYFK
ncbi:MAG: methionine--tRNA ligase [Clostridia bacterium]